MIVVWRIVLVGVALFLAWRVVATGLGSYYADRMQAGDDGAYEQVLTWLPEHPGALLTQAVRLMAEDPAQAQALLARAYRANPTDPRPLMVLANQYAADRGDRACGCTDGDRDDADTGRPAHPKATRGLLGRARRCGARAAPSVDGDGGGPSRSGGN